MGGEAPDNDGRIRGSCLPLMLTRLHTVSIVLPHEHDSTDFYRHSILVHAALKRATATLLSEKQRKKTAKPSANNRNKQYALVPFIS